MFEKKNIVVGDKIYILVEEDLEKSKDIAYYVKEIIKNDNIVKVILIPSNKINIRKLLLQLKNKVEIKK